MLTHNKSKVVVVTGGSKGLGFSTITALLKDGYRVATCSRKKTEAVTGLEQTHQGRFLWCPCTVGSETEEEKFFDKVIEWSEGDELYGWINNAAVARDGILASYPTVEAARILETNLLAVLRFCRLALRIMLAQDAPGRIINISSIIGSRGYTGLSAYAASKAGMDGLTRALAREVGRRGITVNSVAPGYLDTDLSASLKDAQRRQMTNRTPLGRLGLVEDVVPLILFLLGPGGAFITGQTIIVDGGITC